MMIIAHISLGRNKMKFSLIVTSVYFLVHIMFFIVCVEGSSIRRCHFCASVLHGCHRESSDNRSTPILTISHPHISENSHNVKNQTMFEEKLWSH